MVRQKVHSASQQVGESRLYRTLDNTAGVSMLSHTLASDSCHALRQKTLQSLYFWLKTGHSVKHRTLGTAFLLSQDKVLVLLSLQNSKVNSILSFHMFCCQIKIKFFLP